MIPGAAGSMHSHGKGCLPREGLEAGQPLADALHTWACELPLGLQLVAATHGAAGLTTAAGRQRIAADPHAAAAVRSRTLLDALQVRAFLHASF